MTEADLLFSITPASATGLVSKGELKRTLYLPGALTSTSKEPF
jgi:hypothetical protein